VRSSVTKRLPLLLLLGVIGLSGYLLTRPDPEDDGWGDIGEEEWLG